MDLSQRHPGVQEAMRWLEPNPQLPPHLLHISRHFFDLGEELLRDVCEDSPQLTLALNKLVEVKDCAVRARIRSDELDDERYGKAAEAAPDAVS